jgi:hypothetical protein
MTRIINCLVLVSALAGFVMLVRQRQTLEVVREEHDRLAAKYGVLDVKDPSKYLITQIDTGDPNHFLWRCYYPAKLRVKEVIALGQGGRTTGSTFRLDAGESLQRCRFEFQEEHALMHYMDRGGGGRMSFAPKELVAMLKEHWDELQIDVLASEGTIELPIDQALPFLTIRIPPELLAELPPQLRDRYATGYVFQMLYGTEEAVAAVEEKQVGNAP